MIESTGETSQRLDRPGILRYIVEDGVLTLTLDRPDALNALDVPLKQALLAGLEAAALDPTVRVIVITGSGRAFCAGQDLRERLEPAAAPLDVEIRERYNPIVLALRAIEKPVIAAVNGVAAGAGASLAFACDFRLAVEDARFLLAFGRIGLIPDSGLTWLLPRLVGVARAYELAFATEPLSARDAAALGLVNLVVPTGRLADETSALANRLASGAPLALGLTKRAMNLAADVGLEEALEIEATLQGIAGASADHAEGLAAFLEKRPPRFTGE